MRFQSFCSTKRTGKYVKAKLVPVSAALLVFSAFAFLNADGQRVHLLRFPLQSRDPDLPSFEGYEFPEDPRIINTGDGNWFHGWPFAGLLRVGVYSLGDARTVLRPHGFYSRWPIDDSPWDHINVYAWSINFAIALVVSLDTYFSAKKCVARRSQVTIMVLLKATLVVAVLMTFRRFLLDVHDVIETVTMTVALTGITVTLTRVICGVGSLWQLLQNNAMHAESPSRGF